MISDIEFTKMKYKKFRFICTLRALILFNSYYNSIASGLMISPEKAALLLNGHNQYFANVKKTVKDHMLCNENLSRLHFDALKDFFHGGLGAYVTTVFCMM